MYGTAVESWSTRNLIGRVETTANGNIALSIGREHQSGWVKIAHVTLTPEEASTLGSELIARADETLGVA